MSSSLYQKYRPQTFSEVSGQLITIRTLTNAIKNNHIGHAYLFTGPRGTGKTTLARIFAKTINCLTPRLIKKGNFVIEPCNQCENCNLIQDEKALDLVEIDAASHTGVDNIRALKKTVVLPPQGLKNKIYIIDEVHMLSMGAFNALLKTLEEPPAHAIFILATTELHKVPDTIVSRCQRFNITPLTQKQIIQRLSQIAKKENVVIDQEAIETIALEAEGGMRDAESMLTQVMALEDKHISALEVQQILGFSSKKRVVDFIKLILTDKISRALEEVTRLQSEGISLKNFNKNILDHLRNLMIIKSVNEAEQKNILSLSEEKLIEFRKNVNQVPLEKILSLIDVFEKSLEKFKQTTFPQLPLELAVAELYTKSSPSLSSQKNIQSPESTHQDNNENIVKKNKTQPKNKYSKKPLVNKKPPTISNSTTQSTATKKTVTSSNIDLGKIMEKWSNVLEAIKPFNHSIHAFLKNCTPCGLKEDTLFIKTKYDFYKDKLSETENKLTLQKVIAKIFGVSLKVSFLTETESKAMNFDTPTQKDTNILHQAMQVMGGQIVN